MSLAHEHGAQEVHLSLKVTPVGHPSFDRLNHGVDHVDILSVGTSRIRGMSPRGIQL